MRDKNSNIKIRLAKMSEANNIAALLYDSFLEYKPLYTDKAFAATIMGVEKIQERISEKKVWVALYKTIISGTISLIPLNKLLWVKTVAVAPTARRRGVGKALMKHAEKEALKIGFQQLELTTTAFLFEAIALYESFGFEQYGYEDLHGTQLIKMKKHLNPSIVSRSEDVTILNN